MKKKHFLILFLITVFCGFSQTPTIDSLKNELGIKQHDTIKAQIISDLSYYYISHSLDSALLYGRKLEKFSSQIHSPKYKALAFKNIGNTFLYLNAYDSSQFYYRKSLKVADSASLNKSALYSNLGVLYKRQGNYEEAFETYLEGLKYDEENSNTYGQFIKLLNISNLYSRLEDYTKSNIYAQKALELSKTTADVNIEYVLGTLLNNIGTNYIELDDIEKSLDYLNKALIINQKKGNKKEISRNYNNIGNVYDKLNQNRKALDFLNKALNLRNELGDELELIETNMSLGSVYGKVGQSSKSIFHFNKALELAKKIENPALISETYLAISNNYSLKNEEKSALKNYKNYIIYKDSAFNIENIKSINDLEFKYEAEKKDKELIAQKLQLKHQENQIQKKTTQYSIMTGIAIFLLVSSLLGWFLYQQRQKRKNQEIITLKREQQVKTLESLMEGEEKERYRIAKELHDGVNGDLSAIKYKLTSMLEHNTSVVNEVVAMIDKSSEQVRAISHNLVPPSLEKFDLIEALNDYCTTMNDAQDPTINFQHIGAPAKLSKNNEINIYRIVQELVNNGIKHSKASEITVQLSCRDNYIQITVEDNGKGFDPKKTENTGIGLKNIASRIEYLNATQDLVTNSKGTSYTIEIDTNKLNDN